MAGASSRCYAGVWSGESVLLDAECHVVQTRTAPQYPLCGTYTYNTQCNNYNHIHIQYPFVKVYQ